MWTISYQHISQNYGVALAAANHPDAAAKVLLKSLSLSEELFGADSAPTGDAHNELASALQDLGRFREALPHYQEAIRINRLASSEESADRARAINNLASLYEDMGDYVLAVPLLRESLEIREHLLPEDDMMILVARYNLGRVLAKARDLEHARTLLDSVRLTALERFGQSHEITVKADLWLAIVDVRLGDTAAAAVALEKLDTSTAPFSPYMLAMRSTLRAELAFARHDEATLLESRKTAWEDMKKGLGERHPLTAEFGITYAAALADAGRLRAAREIAKPLVPIINDAFVSTSDVRRIAARWDT